jgi:GT2 family glycosyltransferase
MSGIRQPAINVIVVTRNRGRVLEDTLHSLTAQRTSADWELIVVDNGSTDDTAAVIERFRGHLPLLMLCEPQPGKSRGLNRAMDVASGRLLVFTDDDVRVSGSWLDEYLRALEMYPETGVFCGPIVPEFPPGVPGWLSSHKLASAAFARFDPGIPEGTLAPPRVPYGGNFALRASVAVGVRFRLDLGPSDRGAFMCEDTELLRRLRRRGERIVFLPGAAVTHRIRKESTSLPVLFDRAFALGRSIVISGDRAPAVMNAHLALMNVHRASKSAETEAQWFERAVKVNLWLGQLCQSTLEHNERHSQVISAVIRRAGWTGEPHWLGEAAAEWLQRAEEWRSTFVRTAGQSGWERIG